ncbi:MAG: UDP-N-acetylglucosamine--N-acetylmuramyl-(pentapeptide) pyrophosphoryl-undecaprenol N-acetylglucosamine transferase [Culicoidibacterales bacterium]
MRYILTGGGSGGHIYPLLSLAKIIKKYDKEAEFLFIGKQNKMEAQIVPQANIEFKSVWAAGTKGKISWQNVKAISCLLIGYLQARKIIQQFKPDVCIGAGGYVSVPIMLVAQKIPNIITAVLETDQFMGRANLALAQKSDFVFSGIFDLKAKYFASSQNYFCVGHPRSEELFSKHEMEIAQKKRGDQVVFIGGSLGAQAINEAAISYCHFLQEKQKKQKVLLISGQRYFTQFKEFESLFPNLQVEAFVSDLSSVYLRTEVLICRAGAGILAEAMTFKVPMIIIPSPNVMNNHQYYNGLYFEKRNAAVMIEEKNIRRNSVSELIEQLLTDDKRVEKLLLGLSQIGGNTGASIIYQKILAKKNLEY